MNVMQASFIFTLFTWAWTMVQTIPVWAIWTVGGLGSRYFHFLPLEWQSIPLLHFIGLSFLFCVLRGLISGMQLQMKA